MLQSEVSDMSILALTILGVILLLVLLVIALWPERPVLPDEDRRPAPRTDSSQLHIRSPKAA